MKKIKLFAVLMLCCASVGLTTSCSKDDDDDLIIGTWKIVGGVERYIDSYGVHEEDYRDIGVEVRYANNGDYYYCDLSNACGKWERLDDETILLKFSQDQKEEKILSLTNNELRIREDVETSTDISGNEVKLEYELLLKRQ